MSIYYDIYHEKSRRATKDSPCPTPLAAVGTNSLAARSASAAGVSPCISAFGAESGSLKNGRSARPIFERSWPIFEQLRSRFPGSRGRGIWAKRFATRSGASPSVSLPENSSCSCGNGAS